MTSPLTPRTKENSRNAERAKAEAKTETTTKKTISTQENPSTKPNLAKKVKVSIGSALKEKSTMEAMLKDLKPTRDKKVAVSKAEAEETDITQRRRLEVPAVTPVATTSIMTTTSPERPRCTRRKKTKIRRDKVSTRRLTRQSPRTQGHLSSRSSLGRKKKVRSSTVL